jgi:putative ABC transport system permease protein
LSDLNLSPVREAEIVEELSEHLEDRYRELLAAGVDEKEARRAALDDLSDPKSLVQELRRVENPITIQAVIPDAGGGKGNIMADLGQDLR